MSSFRKATREKVFLKVAVTGPSGSGKTFSSLRMATGLANGGKVAVLDTENRSASLYADRFNFDVLDIEPPFDHDKFESGISDAVAAGYTVGVIDSASHFWEGILEYKSALDARGGNSYTNWNEAGKKFSGIIKAVLQSPIHLICCMRSKMDYILETNERGKQTPRKVGLAPIMRDGIEYEFTTVFDVAIDHKAQTSKDRTGLFRDRIFQIEESTGSELLAWLNSGAEPAWKIELASLLTPRAEAANAYLATLGWVKPGESFTAISEANARKILSKPEGFLAKLGGAQ